MIIGEFNDSFPPLMDGVGGVVNNYRKELTALGNTVYVVAGGYDDAPAYDEKMGWGDTVLRMPGKVVERLKPYGSLRTPKELREKLMDIDFDIIHIHSPFYSGHLGCEIAAKKHIPLVGTFHTQFRDDIDGFVFHMKPLRELAVSYVMRNIHSCKRKGFLSPTDSPILLTFLPSPCQNGSVDKRNDSVMGTFSKSLFANVFNVTISTLTGLLIPKLMGATQYGYWQLYVLYVTYVPYFHFGWVDGIYLREGGIDYNDLDKPKLHTQFWMYCIFDLAVSLGILSLGFAFVGGERHIMGINCGKRFRFMVLRQCSWLFCMIRRPVCCCIGR